MEKGVRKDLVTMVEDIFGETRRKVKLGKYMGKLFRTWRGVRQFAR